jgi:hypothetical protein
MPQVHKLAQGLGKYLGYHVGTFLVINTLSRDQYPAPINYLVVVPVKLEETQVN